MKTIRMKKEDWQKWDAALRSGEYGQCDGRLSDGQGNYCCLGVLEKALDNDVESNSDELPSREWLESHGITFDAGEAAPDASTIGRSPLLEINGGKLLASVANDEMLYDDDGDENSEHKYDFIAIADAIEQAVEFTDA